jgi:hypothetical protein
VSIRFTFECGEQVLDGEFIFGGDGWHWLVS